MQTPGAGHTPQGALFTEVVLEIFRLNGALIGAGNRLGGSSGLTAARWQTLGAIALAGRALTVSQIARTMGLTRQSVQRVVDELEGSGIVRRTAHPESRRARLVSLTAAGESAYAKVSGRQRPWANRLAQGATQAQLTTALHVVRRLREQLETEEHDHATAET